MLLAGILAGGIFVSEARAQSPSAAAQPPVAGVQSRAPATAAAARYRPRPSRMPSREDRFYGMVWGVDSLSVKTTESGEIVRFRYRVVDAEKAQALHDKKADPFLIDPQAGVKLVVPTMEKVGQLRQSSTPEVGRSYWMAFSNAGRIVKRGDRVNIVIGRFHADGLVVE
jgi:hypothetical protein